MMQYEMKFQLDGNKILSGENELRAGLVPLNQSELQQLDIRFLDTAGLDFYHSGWILRGRLKQNKDKWEITYKKRTPIRPSETVEEAVQRMKAEGFDPDDPALGMEVDWSGEGRQTLNFSYEIKASVSQLQSAADWSELFLRHSPAQLRQTRWGELDVAALLSKTIVYGPIHARKYKGECGGLQASVEVWTAAGQSIVEITTEAAGAEAAQSSREQLKRALQQHQVFPLQTAMSKTQWALRQLQHAEHAAASFHS